MDLQIQDYYIIKNPEDKDDNITDGEEESDNDRNDDTIQSEPSDEVINEKEDLTLTSAKTVGDISLLLHDTVFYHSIEKDKDNCKYITGEIEKMKVKGSDCKISLSKEGNNTSIYYVPERLQELIEESI